MSPAVPSALSSSSSSQRPARGGRGSAWSASSKGKGKGATGKGAAGERSSGSTAASNRFWVQTLNRERANEIQLRQRSYGLSILQQPEKARLSSFKDSSDTSDRRPVDPPIILQVHATDSRTDDHPSEFLESVSFFTRAHLVAVDPVAGETITKESVPDEVMHAGGDWWRRVKGPKGGEPIAGEELVGGEKMADPQGRMGVFFIFSKLSIRVPGKYRLLFSLYEITGSVVRKKAAVTSEVFEVFSPKARLYRARYRPAHPTCWLFTGMTASTPLTKHFARQGVKVKIRGTGPLTASASRLQPEPPIHGHLGPPPPPLPPPLQHQPPLATIGDAYGSSGSGSGGSRTRKAEDDLRGTTDHYRWSGADEGTSTWRGAGAGGGVDQSPVGHMAPPTGGAAAYAPGYYAAEPPRAYDAPSLPHLSQLGPYPTHERPVPSTAPPGAPAWSEPSRAPPPPPPPPPPRSTAFPYESTAPPLPYGDSRHPWAPSYSAPLRAPHQGYSHPPPAPGSSEQQQRHVDLESPRTTAGAPWEHETGAYLSSDPGGSHALAEAHDHAPPATHWPSSYPLQPLPSTLPPGSTSSPGFAAAAASQPTFTFSATAPPAGSYRDRHLGQAYAESSPSGLTSPSTTRSSPRNSGRTAYLPNPSPHALPVDYRFYQPTDDRQQQQQPPRGPLATGSGDRSSHDSFGYSYRPGMFRDSGDPWDRVLHPNLAHDPAFMGSYPAELGGESMSIRPTDLASFPREPPRADTNVAAEDQQQRQRQPSAYGYPTEEQQQEQLRPPPQSPAADQQGYAYSLAPPGTIDPALAGGGVDPPSSPSHNP